MMEAVPPHRRADAVLAFLDGTSDENGAAAALSQALMYVGARARHRCFTSLSTTPEFTAAERFRLGGLLHTNVPGTVHSGCQTELTWAGVDERVSNVETAAAEQEAAQIGLVGTAGGLEHSSAHHPHPHLNPISIVCL